jgi:hypothetical protein
MNIKDGILLMLASLVFGWLLLKAHPTIKDPMALGEIAVIDTIKPVIQQDTIKLVSNRTLYIVLKARTHCL